MIESKLEVSVILSACSLSGNWINLLLQSKFQIPVLSGFPFFVREILGLFRRLLLLLLLLFVLVLVGAPVAEPAKKASYG